MARTGHGSAAASSFEVVLNWFEELLAHFWLDLLKKEPRWRAGTHGSVSARSQGDGWADSFCGE